MQEKMPRIKLTSTVVAISIFLFCNCSYSQSDTDDKQVFDYRANINKYQQLHETEPNNCFYIEQIASSYQALNDFDNAIIYYQQTLENCPNKVLAKFQLGVCFYLIMDREKGIAYMDDAIIGAEQRKDSEMVTMLKEEKEAWLDKWDSVKQLEWNKK